MDENAPRIGARGKLSTAANQSSSLVVCVRSALRFLDRDTTQAARSQDPPADVVQAAGEDAATAALAQQAALTAEWFDSWRRANTLGWEYLNAVSGLFRVNMSALSGATRFMPPFPPLP